VAVVTGAARGQGETTARLFAAEGAKVALVDVNPQGAAVAKDIGPAASFHKFDIAQEDRWAEFTEALLKTWGHVDILINNAAVVHAADLLSLKRADFERVLNINVIGSWIGLRTLGAHMVAQGSGSIVNVCSVAGISAQNGLGAYATSKWALRGLTKVAALGLGCRGVRVNSIYPGGIESPMAYDATGPDRPPTPDYQGRPIPRLGRPEEVAYTSLFLASDESSYLCGAEIAVDGGLTVGKYYDFLPGAPPARN
jgi:3alpha(or 20beta)-hydroxysteroid dehydrogenase